MTNKIIVGALLTIVVLFSVPLTTTAAEVAMEIVPQTVEIGAFYNGVDIKVKGTAPENAEVLLRISGTPEEAHVKKKGKVGGLLWMNTGDLTFENVPNVYMLFSGKGLEKDIEDPVLGLGFGALKKTVGIAPASNENDFFMKEFIRLKNKQKLYTTDTAAVSYGSAANGVRPFQASLRIPPRMQQGTYKVEAFAVAGKMVAGSSEGTLDLKQVGFPAMLSNLAFNHALGYGIMAVFIALFAGMATGILFKDKGGAH